MKKRTETLKIINGLMNDKEEMMNFRERTNRVLSIKKERKNEEAQRKESISKIESILVDI